MDRHTCSEEKSPGSFSVALKRPRFFLSVITAKIIKKELPLHADIFSHSKQPYHYLYSDTNKNSPGTITDAITEEIRFALDAELPECTTDG